MTPRLIALAGPLEGGVFNLSSSEASIGRDSSNHIHLNDTSVSRKHCCISQDGDRFLLCDLESMNGTFVNDVPVRERMLSEGDRVKIGGTLFLFILREIEPNPTSSKTQYDDGRAVTSTTVVLHIDKPPYLHPQDMKSAIPVSERLARDLNALLQVSATINQIRRLGELREKLLQLIFDVLPAERGAILLDKDFFDLSDHLYFADRTGGREPFKLSRTVIDRVRAECVAILSNDVAENALFRASSLTISHIRSLLVIPIQLDKRQLGIIYLDSSNPETKFDENHLKLISAIAALSAVAFDNVRHLEWLANETRRLRDEISLNHDMIGESEPMRAVYQMIAKVAPSDSTILIRGENGTGKELAAREIHQKSPRKDQPFIPINCAGLSESLLDSDLFGHEKGAFTGAVTEKKGKLELANGGTVFLDELGEMPLPLQAKLLRVLQTREFERGGGRRTTKVDIRLIAATNRDLEAAIKTGEFRQDLLYRLNVISFRMPELKDRRDDIPLLAHYFAMKYAQRCKRPVRGLSPQARALLVNYDWPGNVRELENAIERAVVLGTTDTILPEDLPETLHEGIQPANIQETKYHAATREAKRTLILQKLEQTGGNYTQAAKLLDIHPSNLHRLIRNLGLKSELKK